MVESLRNETGKGYSDTVEMGRHGPALGIVLVTSHIAVIKHQDKSNARKEGSIWLTVPKGYRPSWHRGVRGHGGKNQRLACHGALAVRKQKAASSCTQIIFFF